MWPAVTTLDLRGKGELIVFFRQAFAVFLHDLADGNSPEYRRGDSQTFEHGGSPANEKRPATQR